MCKKVFNDVASQAFTHNKHQETGSAPFFTLFFWPVTFLFGCTLDWNIRKYFLYYISRLLHADTLYDAMACICNIIRDALLISIFERLPRPTNLMAHPFIFALRYEQNPTGYYKTKKMPCDPISAFISFSVPRAKLQNPRMAIVIFKFYCYHSIALSLGQTLFEREPFTMN